MPSIQVRDVAPDVHAALVRKARREGLSLQQYLERELSRLALTPSLNDVLDHVAGRGGVSLTSDEVVAALNDERARR